MSLGIFAQYSSSNYKTVSALVKLVVCVEGGGGGGSACLQASPSVAAKDSTPFVFFSFEYEK